ncbi:hypothetical protein PABG_06054 [Paracoccidioides brasiliensis Pb03]|nr:hypothetical protein PABG_06054 [Paracoccidioides brasiliensis Pb03]
MEPVVFDDSMEVTSDEEQGNIDDIEIDLDLAHDRLPEHDEDVIVDDASATASDHPAAGDDATYDADMADGQYIDGGISGHGYHNCHQEGYYQYEEDSAYHNPNDYEAEMEDGYEEDIDAPIPDTGFEETNVPTANEGRQVEREVEVREEEIQREVNIPDNEQQPPAPRISSNSEPVETEISRRASVAEEEVIIQKGTSIGQPEIDKFAVEEYNIIPHAPESAKPLNVEEGHGNGDSEAQPALEDEGGHGEDELESQGPGSSEHEHQEPEPRGRYQSPLDQEKLSDTTETYHFVKPEDYVGDGGKGHLDRSGALHPVKVIYHESEVSLFPPEEGDLSDTFFLRDEGLAYAPIGELVEACRQVLGEHISKDEELIVDIESLGLHLPEYSAGRTTPSLVQIIQVYLDLCANDGINEPEPLYLTLSSRSNFMSDYSRLVAAAHEGKGLSYLTWEDYDIDSAEGVEHGEEHEQNNLTSEDASSPVELQPDHSEPPEEEKEVAADTQAKILPPDSAGENSLIQSTNQDLPRPEEPKPHAARSDNDQIIHGDLPSEVVGHDNAGLPHNAEEYDDSQSVEGEDEGVEVEVEVYEEDDLGSEHGVIAEDPQDSTGYDSPTAEKPMKIPTVDLSKDESTDQQSEAYVDEYAFNHALLQLEDGLTTEANVEEEYQDGADLETEEDHAESHTISLDNREEPENHIQAETNNDAHIEIDLRTSETVREEESPVDHDGEDVDECEIFKPEDGISDTENGTGALLSNVGEQPTPPLMSESYTGERQKTPESTHDIFEIDEDLFKSPVAKTHTAIPAIDSTNGSPLDGANHEPFACPDETQTVRGRKPTSVCDPNHAAGGPMAAYFDESLTTNYLDTEAPDPDDLSAPASPKSTKRSFIDSGMNDVEGSTPDFKRQRSE